ncbi:MAG: protein kinase domain-containing protein [Streptosporangiaceae bacterium]
MTNTSPPQSDTAGFTAGLRISGYRLEQQIGRGGMAAVFRAHDERLDRQVALKILAPVLAQDDGFRQRFIAESRAAAAVEDPHIIPVYEAGEADGVLFIAMRLVRGGDLRTMVAQHGPLAAARAEWILSAVASALDSAHACGLVHRDVKPANMLLDMRPGRPDHVYLSDFGVSKASVGSSGLTGSGQFIGTVDYAAPEQIHGQPVDGRTDQYALGCSAFELLCGHPPFFGKQWLAAMYSHLSAPPPAATAVRDELPPAVNDVFARVLAKSPADRFQTCQQFTGALREALGLEPYAVGGHAGESPPRDGDATLDPAAFDRFAFRIRGPAEWAGAAGAAAAGTDPRATAQLTAAGTDRPPAGASSVKHARKVLLAALAGVVLLGGSAAGVLLTRGQAPSPARYQFARQSYPGGLGITQLWTLAGRGGSSLAVAITVTNAASKAVTAELVEPIPVAVASDLHAVSFTGAATPLVAGRLVVWDLRLPAGGRATVGYQVPEAPSGTSESRLMRWVQAYTAVSGQQVLTAVPHAGLLKSVWISPLNLHVNVGQAGRLTAYARLYNSALAPRADLAGAVWTSANPAVLVVDASGTVIGMSPGVTLVTVEIGGIRASATVVVNGSGVLPPPAYSLPPVQPSASPSPSPSVSPSPTGTSPSSGSPSASGTPPPSTPPPSPAPG